MCWYAELTSIVEQNKDCCSKMQDNGVEYIDKMKICAVLLFISTKYVWYDFLMCLWNCGCTSCCPLAIFYLCVLLGDKCTKATAEKWHTWSPHCRGQTSLYSEVFLQVFLIIYQPSECCYTHSKVYRIRDFIKVIPYWYWLLLCHTSSG